MFQTNTAREIFYIFLWLAGIILLYTLVHTFILEPSNEKATTSHNAHAIASKEHKTPTASKEPISKKEEKHTQSHTNVATEAVSTPQVAVPVKVAKVEVVQKSKVETAPKVKDNTTLEKVDKELLQNTVESSVKAVSTPSVPSVVTMPKESISIPSTPSVPTVPTVSNNEMGKITKAPVKIIEKTEEITVLTKELKKELSRDEKMELIESARELVIKQAEDARNKAMESLEK